MGVSKDYGKWDLSFGQKNLTPIHYLSTISFGESNSGPPDCHLPHDDNLNQKATLKDTAM
jgi:hypothetical protein